MAINSSFNNVQDIDKALSETGFSDMNKNVTLTDPNNVPQPMDGSAPVQPVPTNEDEPSLVADIALAPVRGVLDAAEEVAQLVTFNNVSDGTINFLGDSKTTAGGVVQSATSFLAGFTPGFGYLSALSKANKLAKLGKVGLMLAKAPVRGAVAGAIADFAVFDEHQKRLSNLIEDFPQLQNPITDYLAEKDDDGLFAGRVKNALEGLVVGSAVEGVIKGIKGLKGARTAVETGNAAEAKKILDNAGIEIEQNLKDSNVDSPAQIEATFKQKEAPMGDDMDIPVGQLASPEASPKIPEISVIRPEDEAEAIIPTGVTQIDPRTMAPVEVKMKVAEYIGAAPKLEEFLKVYESDPKNLESIRRALMDGDNPIINLGAHSGPEAVSKTKTAVVKVLADKFESISMPRRSQDEVLSDAYDLAKQWGGENYLAEWTKRAGNLSRLDAEVRAMQIISGDMLDQVGKKAQAWSDASKRFKANPFDIEAKRIATEEEINLLEMWPKMQEMLLSYKAQGTGIARGLAARRWTKDVMKKVEAFSKSGREPLEGGAQMFWAKNAKSMDEYLTYIRAEAGNGDLEAGTRSVSEALGRMKTLFDDYGPYGLVRMPPNKFWMKLHNEFWINSLLSGPKTFFVNTLGNAVTTMYKPFEAAMGAQVAYMKSGFKNTFFRDMRNSYLGSYGTLLSDVRDSWKAATEAFKTGESGLVPGSSPIEVSEGIITKENFAAKLRELELNNPGASELSRGLAKFFATSAIDRVGEVVRMPTRFLMMMDEFTKQVNFRNFSKARALTEVINANPNISMAEAASRVQDRLDSLIMDGGRLYSQQGLRFQAAREAKARGMFGLEAQGYIEDYVEKNFDPTKSSLAEYAFGQAQEATFTKRGAPGSVQKKIERFVSEHPSARLLIPFVTTPSNILKFFGQRAIAPLPALIEKNLKQGTFKGIENARLELTKELMSADPFIKAHAEGKIAMGSTLVSLALAAKMGGLITGQGADNEKERTLKQATGWLPYSFKVGDKYIQYQRLDPFATFLGFIADFHDRVQTGQIRDEGTIEYTMSALATAIAKNITSKSYLTGIQQVMEALDNPDRKMDKFMQTRVGSLVVPALVAQSVPIGDPYIREARNIMDAVTRRLPGPSEYLDPKRNILGEPIQRASGVFPDSGVDDAFSPIAVNTNKQDRVMEELSSLGYAFSMPPVIEQGGINLVDYQNKKGQSAYDRYLELTSTLKINNRTLRDSLTKLIGSRNYQKLDPENLMDEYESPRIGEIKKVIGKYRSYAREKMLTEFPELFKDRELRDRIKTARQRGDSITAQRLLSQLKMEPVFNE